MNPRPLVVAYHAVGDWPSRLAIPVEVLRVQLSLLRRRGYVGLTASEAEQRRRNGTLPRRSAVITFDDGFRSVLRAGPVLDELGFPATVFVVSSFVESGAPLSWPGIQGLPAPESEFESLRWNDLELLRKAGWEVGSHTASHRLLPDLHEADLVDELSESARLLRSRLGECESIAYPYGRTDSRVAAAAARAGYRTGFSLGTVHRPDEPLRRPRLELRTEHTGIRLRMRLSSSVEFARRSTVAGAISNSRRRLAPRPAWLPPAAC